MKEMKESNIVYIGRIPQEWSIAKIKNVVTRPVTTGAGEEAQDFSDNSIRYIRISDFNKDGDILEDKAAYIHKSKGMKYLLEPGDILAATAGATVGKTLLFQGLDEPACYAGYLANIKVDKSKMNNKYLLYQMHCSIMDDFRAFAVKKSTIENISANLYENMCIILPPLSEQNNIVDFLDLKCKKINTLSADIQKEIETLEEYKKSLVFGAVCHGIKDTELVVTESVIWDALPREWELKDIKYIIDIKKRIAGKEGYDVLSITQRGIQIKDISTNEGQLASDYSGYQFVYPGEFAMNHMDLLTGWVDVSPYFGVTSPDYRVFALKDNEKFDVTYYKYVMQCCYMNRIFYSLGQGVSNLGRWRLQTSVFNNFKVPVPPYNEQVEIGHYLDKQIKEVDAIIEQKHEQLTVLSDYKKSLIYEYVTGKKEVPTK